MRFRTFLTTNNSRGNLVNVGKPDFAHIRGWDAGVKITCAMDEDNLDIFHVYMSAGSNGHTDVWLGTVHQTPNGPRWEPRPDVPLFAEDAPEDVSERFEISSAGLIRGQGNDG